MSCCVRNHRGAVAVGVKTTTCSAAPFHQKFRKSKCLVDLGRLLVGVGERGSMMPL